MSVNALLNLLNELGKAIKYGACRTFFNVFNTLDYVHHDIKIIFKSRRCCHYVRNSVMSVIS